MDQQRSYYSTAQGPIYSQGPVNIYIYIYIYIQYVQYPVISHNGKEYTKECIYMYN